MFTQHNSKFRYQDKEQGEEVFKAEVYYALGGSNMFTYKQEPRGIYFSISAVKIELRDGMKIESFMVFQNKGLKTLILPLERKSAKQLAGIVAKLEPHVAEIVELFKTDQRAAFQRVHALTCADCAMHGVSGPCDRHQPAKKEMA
jgi:hypothetical protein